MYCKKCGKQIDDDSFFCSICGTKQSILHNNEFDVNFNFKEKETKIVNEHLSFDNQITSKPIDKTNNFKAQILKYDPIYKKETDASGVGILMLVATVLIYIISRNINDKETYKFFFSITSIILLILRIIFTVWGVNIAKRQNRNAAIWGFLTFFLPAISLIILGNQNKLFDNFGIVEKFTNEKNSTIVSEKANLFFQNKEYYKCIVYAEKAIELNPINKFAKELLLKAMLEIPSTSIPNKDKKIAYRKTVDNKILKIISSDYQAIGADVFIDEVKAPDGEYRYLNKNIALIVRNGKIEKTISTKNN